MYNCIYLYLLIIIKLIKINGRFYGYTYSQCLAYSKVPAKEPSWKALFGKLMVSHKKEMLLLVSFELKCVFQKEEL